MTRDDEQCMKLGREVVRMIRDLETAARKDAGYALRNITFPGGNVHLFVVKDSELASAFEASAEKDFNVKTITPQSELN